MFELCGEISMPFSEFWKLNPRQFWAYYKGWAKGKEAVLIAQRNFTYCIMLSSGNYKKNELKPEHIMRFSSDPKPKAKTSKEIKSGIEEMNRRVKLQKGKKRKKIAQSELEKYT